jgi:hypothetical protein
MSAKNKYAAVLAGAVLLGFSVPSMANCRDNMGRYGISAEPEDIQARLLSRCQERERADRERNAQAAAYVANMTPAQLQNAYLLNLDPYQWWAYQIGNSRHWGW